LILAIITHHAIDVKHRFDGRYRQE